MMRYDKQNGLLFRLALRLSPLFSYQIALYAKMFFDLRGIISLTRVGRALSLDRLQTLY
jgi:hypothetical protein